MNRVEQFKLQIKKYETEYVEFMGIDCFPNYRLELYEINIDEVDKEGFGALAQAIYNPKTDEHILRMCINLELRKYIVFHEFTHILNTELYAKYDSARYAYLSGYTEYHASQVELMVLLGAKNINQIDFIFSLDSTIETIPFSQNVEEYLSVKYQFVVDMMRRFSSKYKYFEVNSRYFI